MPDIIDSYSETHENTVEPVGNIAVFGGTGGLGQCFTGNGYQITDAKFFLTRDATVDGNCVAKIWSMTGTFGVDGNVGTLLATSDNVASTSVTGSLTLITFTFSGGNQYVTTNGTHYIVTFECNSSTGGRVYLGYDSAGTHPGNFVFYNIGTGQDNWTSATGASLCFYVEGVPVNVTVDLTGVAASPVLGTGTVEITAGRPAYAFGGPVRFEPRRRKPIPEPELPYIPLTKPPPPVVRVRAQGTKSVATIGKISFDAGIDLQPFRVRYAVIDSRSIINSTFNIEPVPLPVVLVGNGSINVTAELLDEEILALIQ